jgi:hypothetical protein
MVPFLNFRLLIKTSCNISLWILLFTFWTYSSLSPLHEQSKKTAHISAKVYITILQSQLHCHPTTHLQHHKSKMFSCSNYQRGCRGRTNQTNGNCQDCISLHLTRPNTSSTSSLASNSSSYSAMSSAFASLASAQGTTRS